MKLLNYSVMAVIFIGLSACLDVETRDSNRIPVAHSQIVSTDEDTSINIILSGSDANNDAITLNLKSSPQHGTISGVSPNLIYTPDTDFNGTDSFIFDGSDYAGASNEATVLITVNAINDAPVMPDLQATTPPLSSITIPLNANDPDGDTLSYSVQSNPASGTVILDTLADPQTITYTPSNAIIGDQDGFTVTVDDGNGEIITATLLVDIQSYAQSSNDTDGDGLIDADEVNLYYTSPLLVDSDGDSLSDHEEIVNLGFNATQNPRRFNPLIADTPRIQVTMTSVPSIGFNYETSDGTSKSLSTSRSNTNLTSTTESKGGSDESHWEITGTQTATYKTDSAGGETSVTAGGGESNTTTWNTDNTTENSSTLEQGESFENNNSISQSSGSLSVSIQVTNKGSMPLTLTNLILGATMEDLQNPDLVSPIGNLNIDASAFSQFASFSLAPNQTSGNLVYGNFALDLNTTKAILRDSEAITIEPSLVEMTNADGIPFAFQETELSAKTAFVQIDYGHLRNPESYRVSVVSDYSDRITTLADIFSKIIHVPYTADANSVLSIRNFLGGNAPGALANSHWEARIIGNAGVSQTIRIFDDIGSGSNLDYTFAILNDTVMNGTEVLPGDRVLFAYMADEDGNGLGLRAEFLANTNPKVADTDGDGLNDSEEINGWTVSVQEVGEMRNNWIGYGKAAAWPSAPHAGFRAFNGLIDDVSLWTVEKTAQEVATDAARTVSLIPPSGISPSGLKAYYPLDVLTTGTTEDASGGGHLAAVTGASPIADVGAVGGQAFSLDGTDNLIELPKRLLSAERTITIEARFKTTAANGIIFAYASDDAANFVPAIYVGLDGKLLAELWMGASTNVLTSQTTVNDGAWHHVALTYNDATQAQYLYLDGTLVDGPLLGRMEHLGTTSTIRVHSDPRVIDLDGDGLNDQAEKTALLNPNNADTDGDWILDGTDSSPTVWMESDITSNISPPQVIATTVTTDIDWTVPVLSNDISDYRVVVLEQIVDTAFGQVAQELKSLPLNNTFPSVGDRLTCVDQRPCWEVIHSDATSSSSGAAPLLSRSWQADGKIRQYLFLIRVNNIWYKSSQSQSLFEGASQRITFKFVAVDNRYCRDHTNDYICERAWQMAVDGVNQLVRRDSDYIQGGSNKILTDGLNGPISTFSFIRPAINGSCIGLRTYLAEIDVSTVYRSGDVHKFCYDDGWGSGGTFSTVSDSTGAVDSVFTAAGSAGNTGYEGSFIYFTPTIYIFGNAADVAAGRVAVTARARYQVTIEPAP